VFGEGRRVVGVIGRVLGVIGVVPAMVYMDFAKWVFDYVSLTLQETSKTGS
jgi:hypothetical protein